MCSFRLLGLQRGGVGISRRYTQTRSCKPGSGKPRELQTCQVSTSESIFLPEMVPNTPLSLRAKSKACFASLPCITAGSRRVFCTWQHGDKADSATGKTTSSGHIVNPYRRDTGSCEVHFFIPTFQQILFAGQAEWWKPSCWHTVFLEVTGLLLYQTPAYLLNKSLLNIKISTECKNWCIADSSTEQVTNNPFSSKTNCLPLPTSKTSNTFWVFILALSVQGS